MSAYDIDSIRSLEFRDAVRQRIAMYLGSADMQGIYNAIQEIISNSVDEYYMGFGNLIHIKLKGNHIEISDRGRGVPFGVKEDGSNVLVDIFSRPHTGGKFDEKTYQSAAGLNGIGAKATALSSLDFTVTSIRDEIAAHAVFDKGVLVSYDEKPAKGKTSGTIVAFTPDPEVYNLEKIKIDFKVLKEKCENLSYLTKGLRFVLEEVSPDGSIAETAIFQSKNGIVDLVKKKSTKAVHQNPISYTVEENGELLEIAMMWTKGREEEYVFTNGLYHSEGGTSLTGFKTALTRQMKKALGNSINGETIRTGLVYAISARIRNPSFSNQTKSKVNSPQLNGMAQKAVAEGLEDFAFRNRAEFAKILEFITQELKAEAAAERARKTIREGQKEIKDAGKKKVFNIDKLADAEKLGEDSILLLTEGNSAAGTMARVRDTRKYGILALRGKILNLLSNPIEKAMENEEVKLFLKATGIDILDYQKSKFRYGKVAICVDADAK